MEIHSVQRFLDYYRGIHQRTLSVVNSIPDAHMEWRYAPHRFSPGDTLRHLAAINRYMFAENVAGRPSFYPGHDRALAPDPPAVRAYFLRLHEETVEIYRGLEDHDLQRRCTTPAGITMAVAKWLRAMVEHEVHHRGQLYLILGMLDVPTPPLYGLTSEQVRQRSLSEQF